MGQPPAVLIINLNGNAQKDFKGQPEAVPFKIFTGLK